jgi:hypothetical protein
MRTRNSAPSGHAYEVSARCPSTADAYRDARHALIVENPYRERLRGQLMRAL